ncbi:ABC transporter permease [Puteibacter caeruleilacunae]|nr:ABC transporter permease [Puteibacter caeruleilacunae]
MNSTIIKQIVKISGKEFSRNKLLSIINMAAIVMALILITMASSWAYLTYSPVAPITHANNFTRIYAHDEKGKFLSLTEQQCETINKADLGGYVWYYGRVFSLLGLKRNGKSIDYRFTTAETNFWKALTFEFIEGGPYTQEQYNNKEYVAVISDRLARDYFGSTAVVGKYISYGVFQFKVTGVYKAVHVSQELHWDIYVPHSLVEGIIKNRIETVFHAQQKDAKDNLLRYLDRLNKQNEEGSKITFSTKPYLTSIFDPSSDYVHLGALIAVFLLPIFCFANLFTRKMEIRLPELGIKRAFGATRLDIFLNLILNNILTIGIAAIIALAIAHPLIGFAFNSTGSENIGTDFLHLRFYLYTILLYVLFGIFSALRPAWIVSRRSLVSTINKQ